LGRPTQVERDAGDTTPLELERRAVRRFCGGLGLLVAAAGDVVVVPRVVVVLVSGGDLHREAVGRPCEAT
jgi:hypothetical protein